MVEFNHLGLVPDYSFRFLAAAAVKSSLRVAKILYKYQPRLIPHEFLKKAIRHMCI